MNAWEFIDAMLEEAEIEQKSCSFSPTQVSKLREMIAEIPATGGNGRTRQRFVHGQQLSKTRTIKMPVDIMEQIDTRSATLNISFNMMLTFICNKYLEEVDAVDVFAHFMDNGGISKWQK